MKTRFANFVLISGGALTLFALSRYLYGHTWSGQQPLGAATLAVALAGLAAVFLVSLRLRADVRTAAAVLTVFLAAVLYTGELSLAGSWFGAASTPFWSVDAASQESKREVVAWVRRFGAEIDTRDRIDVIADLRKRGIDAVPAVMLSTILGSGDSTARSGESIEVEELLPLAGLSNSLTVLCNESGQYLTYESDEHGFRNPMGIWNAPRADLAAVGQSLTQGYCVPNGKGFVDLLRRHYPVTLNLGVSGESSLLQLAAIKEYLPRLEPKIVLWFFTEGFDLQDAYEESTHPLVMRYLEPTFSRHLLSRQPEVDAALRRFISDRERRERGTRFTARERSFVERASGIIKLWHLREKVALMYGVQTDDAQPELLEQTAYNLLNWTLGQARNVTNRWGGTLYFVYLPSWSRYRNGPRVSERERTRVLSLVNSLGIPVIDTQSAFQAQKDPLSLFPFRRFGHYNERGNELIAETILTFLSAHE